MNRTQDLLDRRRMLLGSAYRLFYEQPLHITRGEGVWLTDADGNRYLDCYNNVPQVGHCHPQVVEAICTQARKLNTHTRYLHESILDLAERLLARCPAPIDRAMFACSGTEANELALRIAGAATGARGFIATAHAYHGNSVAITQVSPEDTPADMIGDHVALLHIPEAWREGLDGRQVAGRLERGMVEAIDTLQARGHAPAAFIIDTVLSSEGIPHLPAGSLDRAVARLRAAGGLLIADEVQAGFGRLGETFWGFERLGLEPDLVTMGKPMGNGHPVAATLAGHALIDRFSAQSHYFNTFGGNPVSCAAAGAVLDVIEAEDLQGNALRVGDYLLALLGELAGRHSVIGEVRGRGLFLGVELVRDADSREPAGALATRVHNALRDHGVLIGVTGPHGNVLKLRPPLVFERAHADLLAERLDQVLAALS